MAKQLVEVRLENNYIDEVAEDFTLRQITMHGTMVMISPQKPKENAVQKMVPRFIKGIMQ